MPQKHISDRSAPNTYAHTGGYRYYLHTFIY